jgi:AraC-like DNA-binding protein
MKIKLKPTKTPTSAIETTHCLPEKYHPYQVKDADVECLHWEGHTIASQTVQQDAAWIEQSVMEVNEDVWIQATTEEGLLFLCCALEGPSVNSVIEGFGKTLFKEAHMRLCYIPSGTTHYSLVKKGFYVFFYIGVPQLAVQEDHLAPHILQYLLAKCRQQYNGSLLQQNIMITPPTTAAIHQLRWGGRDNPLLQQHATFVSQEYTQALHHLHRNKQITPTGMLVAIKAKDLIDFHFSEKKSDKQYEKKRDKQNEELNIELLANAVGTSSSKLQTAFSRVIGQSIWEYYRETRMLRAQELIAENPEIRVQPLATILGVSTDHLTKCFCERCGLTTSEYIKEVHARLIQEALRG